MNIRIPELKRNLMAFWLCFTTMAVSPSKLLRATVFPVLITIVALCFLSAFVYFLNIEMNEQPSSRPVSKAMLGAKVALALAQETTASSASTSSSESLILEGVSVYIDAPPHMASSLLPALKESGIQISNQKHANITLRWKRDGWVLSSAQPGDNLLVFPTLSAALEKANKPLFAPPNFTEVSSDLVDRKNRQKKVATRDSFVVDLSPVIFMMIFGMMFMVSSITMASEMEEARRSGYLECFALTPAPFWVYTLAHCASQGIQYAVIVLAVLLSVGLFLPPMPILSILFIGVGLLFAATAHSMLGVLHVFIFHSKWSRAIGSAIFGPIGAGFVVMVFIFFGRSHFDKKIASGQHTSLDQLPFLSLPPSSAFFSMLGMIALSLVIITAGCRFLEWRIGPNRHGLSSI